jgi:uncharacterized protein (UPF0332 family)
MGVLWYPLRSIKKTMSDDCGGKELVCFAYNILQKHQKNIEDIFENVSDEVVFRSVINRSYYGAFIKARNLAGIKNQSGSVHRDVISHYENKKLTNISNSLLKLLRNREKADYRINEKVSIQEARSSLTMANKIIEALESQN